MKKLKLTKEEMKQCDRIAGYFTEATNRLGEDRVSETLLVLAVLSPNELKGLCAVFNAAKTAQELTEGKFRDPEGDVLLAMI